MEMRFCLDCNHAGPITVHGLCGTCGSQAVVLAESIYQFTRSWNESIDECEKIWALEGK